MMILKSLYNSDLTLFKHLRAKRFQKRVKLFAEKKRSVFSNYLNTWAEALYMNFNINRPEYKEILWQLEGHSQYHQLFSYVDRYWSADSFNYFRQLMSKNFNLDSYEAMVTFLEGFAEYLRTFKDLKFSYTMNPIDHYEVTKIDGTTFTANYTDIDFVNGTTIHWRSDAVELVQKVVPVRVEKKRSFEWKWHNLTFQSYEDAYNHIKHKILKLSKYVKDE